MRRSFFILLLALIAATLLCVLTNADIRTTALFYQPGTGFPIGNLQPWRFLYRYGEWPAFAMGSAALIPQVWSGPLSSVSGVRLFFWPFSSSSLLVSLLIPYSKTTGADHALNRWICSEARWPSISPGNRGLRQRMPHSLPDIRQSPSTCPHHISSCVKRSAVGRPCSGCGVASCTVVLWGWRVSSKADIL